MTPKLKTLLAGVVASLTSFLALWSALGGQWSAEVLGIFPPQYRPQVTMILAALTAAARIYKSLLDAKGNQHAQDAAAVIADAEISATPPAQPAVSTPARP